MVSQAAESSGRHNRTVQASFVFVDIAGFSKRDTDEQRVLKAQLSSFLRTQLAQFDFSDFRMRDTGDGAMIAFLRLPDHALVLAQAVLRAQMLGTAPFIRPGVRTGVNIGMAWEMGDVEDRTNYIGDAVNSAQRIMDMAQPGQVTVSLSFYRAISEREPQYGALMRPIGERADKHGRKHQVMEMGFAAEALADIAATLPEPLPENLAPAPIEAPQWASSQVDDVPADAAAAANAAAPGTSPWLTAAAIAIGLVALALAWLALQN